jgi:hypothetical protein
MKRLRIAALIIPAMLASGCSPPIHVAWIDWPTIEGKAVDVVTGKPVGGAAVAIHATAADFSANTRTSADGTFQFPRHTHDEWVSYEFNNDFPPAVISVTAPGYDHFESKLDGSMSVESIPLTPLH